MPAGTEHRKKNKKIKKIKKKKKEKRPRIRKRQRWRRLKSPFPSWDALHPHSPSPLQSFSIKISSRDKPLRVTPAWQIRLWNSKIRLLKHIFFSLVGGWKAVLPNMFCFFSRREVNNKFIFFFKQNVCSRLGKEGRPTVIPTMLIHSSFNINSHCSRKMLFSFSKQRLGQGRFILSPSCSA